MSRVDLPIALRKLEGGARRYGKTLLVVEDRDVGFPDATMLAIFLKGFGFAHPDAQLHAILREDAAELVSHLVAFDQAYRAKTEAVDIAAECGSEFVDLFSPEARFFTNSPDRIDAAVRQSSPLTEATFDSGVIAIAPNRVGCVWFEDED